MVRDGADSNYHSNLLKNVMNAILHIALTSWWSEKDVLKKMFSFSVSKTSKLGFSIFCQNCWFVLWGVYAVGVASLLQYNSSGLQTMARDTRRTLSFIQKNTARSNDKRLCWIWDKWGKLLRQIYVAIKVVNAEVKSTCCTLHLLVSVLLL